MRKSMKAALGIKQENCNYTHLLFMPWNFAKRIMILCEEQSVFLNQALY